MALLSSAHTRWEGDLATGSGSTTLASGAATPLEVTWKARTEDHGGLTSPEELIAAAHSACYSMALSGALARAGNPPTSIDTEATATFDKTDDGWRLTAIHLVVRASIAGITPEEFADFANDAKEGCPVSQALKGNVAVTLDASLA